MYTLIVKNCHNEWVIEGHFSSRTSAVEAVKNEPLINWQQPKFEIVKDELADITIGFLVK